MRPFAIAFCVVLFAGAVAAQDQCTVGTASSWLPTKGAFGLNGVVVGDGPPRPVQIDTGSTGLAIGYMHIKNSTDLTPAEIEQYQLEPNYISYNSSGNVPVGKWVYALVQLTLANPPVTIPRVPVLAVQKMCKAASNSMEPEQSCVNGPSVPSDCSLQNQNRDLHAVCTIGMMGVGFNRGPSMGTWQVNPFLNAQPMIGGTMQRGYIVTRNGVRLGMRQEDIGGFQFQSLTSIKPPYEWKQASGCVSITGGGVEDPGTQVCGDILMDTGVDSMFLSYRTMPDFDPPLSCLGDLWNCGIPTKDQPTRCCTKFAEDATVRVTWPDTTGSVFEYRVSTPAQFSAPGPTPARLHVRQTDSLPDPTAKVFVNTSRQLLATADYLYDATCGRIGFRKLPAPPRR